MHILETYSLITGSKIDKCFIQEEVLELPSKPYITIHSYNPKGGSRQYLYWQNVIDEILQITDKYDIVQIGGANDIRLFNVNTWYLGKTNYNSLAYLIKNCSLHVGFDSFPVHLASHYDRKIVAIYQNYSANTKPYFSTDKNIRIIQSDHSNTKPFFQEDNSIDHKKLNEISHTLISKYIMELLLNDR